MLPAVPSWASHPAPQFPQLRDQGAESTRPQCSYGPGVPRAATTLDRCGHHCRRPERSSVRFSKRALLGLPSQLQKQCMLLETYKQQGEQKKSQISSSPFTRAPSAPPGAPGGGTVGHFFLQTFLLAQSCICIHVVYMCHFHRNELAPSMFPQATAAETNPTLSSSSPSPRGQ